MKGPKMPRLKIVPDEKKPSAYPYRAWCPRLKCWVYLTSKPSRKFQLELMACQPVNVATPMPRFQVFSWRLNGIWLGAAMKNPRYKAPK